MVVASILTLSKDGCTGLRRAWHFRQVIACIPAGFLFAFSTALQNMAFSQGMNTALALVLGKFYILVAAIGARWVRGKFYMWLEYVAIAILTLALVTFGYLQAFDIASGVPSLSSLTSMILMICSAAIAAVNSLITERILRGVTIEAHFHPGSIGLDIDWSNCQVIGIDHGGQARLQGIQVGMLVDRIDGVVHSAEMLSRCIVGEFDYTVAFKKGNLEEVPFRMQKIRLDVASVLSSLVLIPVIGLITVEPQNIPWVQRPVSGSCPQSSPCWDLHLHGGNFCENVACACECASGVFAGWASSSWILITLALAINTGYGWLVGRLVQSFGTVHRAIADSFSLLVIYFVGDPLLNHTSLSNMCLNLVALVVPLSVGLFNVAAAEMRKVMRAMGHLERSGTLESFATSDGCTSDVGDQRFIADAPVGSPHETTMSLPEGIAAPSNKWRSAAIAVPLPAR